MGENLNLDKYMIQQDSMIFEALKKIELNKKGFLIVVDNNKTLFGTLTDGDIRRALIKDISVKEKIHNICSKEISKVFIHDNFSKVIEIFKNIKIQFIPIVDENDTVINIVTKPSMHVVMLKSICADLKYNFMDIDVSVLEQEIYDRPWGFYKTILLTEHTQSKIIKINPKEKLSLQEHKRREEYWVVVEGIGNLTIGESFKKISEGDFIYIPKGCKHRLQNISDEIQLTIVEVQLGDYFEEDDIIRYDDIYGRI